MTSAQIVETALSWMGVRWIHCGRNPAVGLDCQGIVTEAYRRNGWQPHDAEIVFDVSYGRRPDVRKMQRVLAGEGREVSLEELAPADVILFRPFHLALVTHRDEKGRVYFLHSNVEVGKVTQTHIDKSWENRFLSGYRFLTGGER